MTFGFREPYQVLGRSTTNGAEHDGQWTNLSAVDADMVQDSCKFKMDLAAGLERTVHGKVKPST